MTPYQSSIINYPLCASVRVPGSKSLTNRALLIAALAEGTTTLTNALESDDSARMIESLQHLGFNLHSSNSQITIHGLDGKITATRAELFVGNAGTAARFLTAMLTLGHGEYVLDGDARMRERPIGDLVDALHQLDVNITGTRFGEGGRGGEVCPPVRIVARGLPGGRASVKGDVSSQFLSGLLMAAPYAQGLIEITVEGELTSKPYVEMTLAVMRDFGVTVERDGYRAFRVSPGRYRAQAEYAIESDASAASYFFAAPAICGGTVRVEHITRRSKQGDIAFLDVLARMGCLIAESDDWIAVTGPEALRGVDVDMRDIPDTAQTLAAIAPFADSPTTIRGIASARVKETDRVSAMCAELARLGVTVEEHPDGLTIYPTRNLQPATIKTYNDHRMAMAFALIGLRAPGVVIENPGCVAKTFPRYFEMLEQLRLSDLAIV